jgi:hypothetical protein
MPEDELRVVIVALPLLLRELFEKAFEERPHYRLLRADGIDELAELVETERPDYVVVPLEHDRLPDACQKLLDERARVKVLGIGEREGRALLIKLRPIEHDLDDAAPHELVRRLEEVSAEGVA